MNRKEIHKIRYRLLDEYPKQKAPRVRAAIAILKKFKFRELEELVPLPDATLKGILRDFKRSGEVRVVETGLYEYIPKKPKRTYQDVIWHLVRSCRRFTINEMVRLSGASRHTVKEYFYCLRDLKFIRKVDRTEWILSKDPGPATPANTGKCRKLKELRQKKKKALKSGG